MCLIICVFSVKNNLMTTLLFFTSSSSSSSLCLNPKNQVKFFENKKHPNPTREKKSCYTKQHADHHGRRGGGGVLVLSLSIVVVSDLFYLKIQANFNEECSCDWYGNSLLHRHWSEGSSGQFKSWKVRHLR